MFVGSVHPERNIAVDCVSYYRGVFIGPDPMGKTTIEEPRSLSAAIVMRHEKIKALNSLGTVARKDELDTALPVPTNRFSIQQKLNMFSSMGNIIDVWPHARFSRWQHNGLLVELGAGQPFETILCLPHANGLKCAATGRNLKIDFKNKQIVVDNGEATLAPTTPEATAPKAALAAPQA